MSKEFILNQRRDFGDALGDSVTFLKKHFKPMASIFLTYVVPLMLVPIILLVMTGSMSDIMDFYSFENMANPSGSPFEGMKVVAVMLGFLFFYMLAYLALNLTVYAAFLAYEENGNVVATTAEIKHKMKENFGNYLISALAFFILFVLFYMLLIGMAIVAGMMGALVTFLLFLVGFPLFVWAINCMTNFSFIRMREKLSISDGIRRSFALTKKNWWSMFGVLFISSIAASIASYIFSIPFYIATFVGASSMSNSDDSSMTGFAMMAGFGFLVYMLGSLFLQKYVTGCTVLKYYDMVEQKDGSSVIAQIDQLGESGESYFENEGEY